MGPSSLPGGRRGRAEYGQRPVAGGATGLGGQLGGRVSAHWIGRVPRVGGSGLTRKLLCWGLWQSTPGFAAAVAIAPDESGQPMTIETGYWVLGAEGPRGASARPRLTHRGAGVTSGSSAGHARTAGGRPCTTSRRTFTGRRGCQAASYGGCAGKSAQCSFHRSTSLSDLSCATLAPSEGTFAVAR
jgi:hypothetical protein